MNMPEFENPNKQTPFQTPFPPQPQHRPTTSKTPWGIIIAVIAIMGFGYNNQEKLMSLFSSKVEVREVTSPEKTAEDLVVWKEQYAVLSEQLNAEFKKNFAAIPDSTIAPPAERVATLDLVTKFQEPGDKLGFWDSIRFAISEEGVKKALQPKVPAQFKIESIEQVAVKKIDENKAQFSYKVTLVPTDTIQAVSVKELISMRPELQKYSSIVNQTPLTTDLGPGKAYRFDRAITVAKAASPICVIWDIREAIKESSGWVITKCDPIVFSREYEVQGDQSLRLRTNTELMMQSQQFQQASTLMMARIEEARQKAVQYAQSPKSREKSSNGPNAWDIGNAAMNAVNLGLNIFNAVKK